MKSSPFKVAVPEHELSDLKDRLSRTRWPDQIPGSGWTYGTDLQYLRELCSYWQNTFDWRKTEDRLNEWPQFVTTIDGQQVHFLHIRSREQGATPLLLLHGWPGSVLEFIDLLGPLTDPVRYGGRPEDAFDVVCPSLPGFAFSGPTTEPGWHVGRMAAAVATLMEELGYPRYGVQGGDWGATIGTHLATLMPDRIVGLHINLVVTGGPRPEDGELSAEEAELLEEAAAFNASETGYIAIQSTKPQSLAYGLTDSPAGLAGWMVEKFRAWTDCDGDLESVLDRDQILGAITTYWLTRTIGSSARIYYESLHAGVGGPSDTPVTVPTGCALFPRELYRPSRRWAERHYLDIRRWSHLPRGGHFAALEQPDALTAEIRSFFGSLRLPS